MMRQPVLHAATTDAYPGVRIRTGLDSDGNLEGLPKALAPPRLKHTPPPLPRMCGTIITLPLE